MPLRHNPQALGFVSNYAIWFGTLRFLATGQNLDTISIGVFGAFERREEIEKVQ